MKITTLLIALGLVLQVGASNKKPDANASASASASADGAAETDTKASAHTERDAKSYASQPYTALMHPYAIVADLRSRGLCKVDDAVAMMQAIEHLPLDHKAIIMAFSSVPEQVSDPVERQCDAYTQGLCRIIDALGHDFETHPELLRPLNRQEDVVATLNAVLPQNFVQNLFAIVAGYAVDGFRYGKSVTDVPCNPTPNSSCGVGIISWGALGIDDLTKLGTESAQVPTVNGHGEAIHMINLVHNPIRYLPEGMGAHLGHIAFFDCSWCLLDKIHPKAFAGMQGLYSLKLNYNQLRDLPDEIFALPALRAIYLNGNPLSDDTKQKLETWKKAKAGRDVHYDQDKSKPAK